MNHLWTKGDLWYYLYSYTSTCTLVLRRQEYELARLASALVGDGDDWVMTDESDEAIRQTKRYAPGTQYVASNNFHKLVMIMFDAL